MTPASGAAPAATTGPRGLAAWIALVRPFTLLPPALGMISGALSSLGAGRAVVTGWHAATLVCGGALMAALLNAASNALNQIHDGALDAINKPGRPLATGAISRHAAVTATCLLYAAAVGLACALRPTGAPEIAVIVAFTAALTWAYSAPPIRARNSWWLGPLIIAIPRGLLLKVAGWGTLAPVLADREPWILGSVFFIYVLGAAPTKDFADMAGDRAGGADSLPLHFGAARAARIIAPFFALPGVLLAVLPSVVVAGRPLLTLAPGAAAVAGLVLAGHGCVTARRMVRDPVALTQPGNTRIWRHMYLLMMELQIAAGALYWIGR